ncbi:MAG: NAD-dependent epimerase/dehydratase family protein, partial [Acidimicrobiia bacterium]
MAAAPERIVITGAGGYLGGRVVEHLTGAGHRVAALSRRPAPWLQVPVAPIDLVDDPDEIEGTFEGAAAVIHLAGANEARVVDDPERALTSTIVAARHVAHSCVAMGVKRVVYVSTMHVYGAALAPGASVTEATMPEPCSDYAIARLTA